MVERINFRLRVRGGEQTASTFDRIAGALQSVNAAVAATARAFEKSGAATLASNQEVKVRVVNNYNQIIKAAAAAGESQSAADKLRQTSIGQTLAAATKATQKEVATVKSGQAEILSGLTAFEKSKESIIKAADTKEVRQTTTTEETKKRIEQRSQAQRLAQTTAFLGRVQSVATTTSAAVIRALASLGNIGPSLRSSLGSIERQLNQFGSGAGKTFAGSIVKSITTGFAAIPKVIGDVLGPLTSAIGIVVKAAAQSFNALGASIGGAFSTALATINPVLGAIGGLVTATTFGILGSFTAALGGVAQLFAGLLQGVTGIMSSVTRVVGNSVSQIADLLSNIASQIFSTVGDLVQGTVGRVVSAIGSIFGKLGGIVESGLRAIFSPIGLIIGGLSIKAASDIRDRVVNTFALLDDKTQASVDAVARRLSELATRVGVPIAEVGDLFFNVVSAGFRNLGEAIEIIEQAANLAVAGSARVSDTGKNLITLLRAVKAPAEQAGKAAQFFFDVQDRGVITIQELSTSFPDLVSAIIAAKIPLEEAGALFSVLTLQGASASETATQLQQAILQLAAPIPQARQRMRALGLEIVELSEADNAIITGIENQIIALEERNETLKDGTQAARDNERAIKLLQERLAAELQVRGRFVGVTEALFRIRRLLEELDTDDIRVSRNIVNRIRANKGLIFLADNADLVSQRTQQIGQSADKFLDAVDLADQKISVQIRRTIGELRQLGIAIFDLGKAVTGGSGFELVRRAIRGLRGLIEDAIPLVERFRERVVSLKNSLAAAFQPISGSSITGVFKLIGDAFDAVVSRITSTNIGAAIIGALEGFAGGIADVVSGAEITTIFGRVRDGAKRAREEVDALRGKTVEVDVRTGGVEEARRDIVRLAQGLQDEIGSAANTAGAALDLLFSSGRFGSGLEDGVDRVRGTLSSSLIPLFRRFQEEANGILAGIGVEPIDVELPDLETLTLSTSGIEEAREAFRNLEADARNSVNRALRSVEQLTDPRVGEIKIAVQGIEVAEGKVVRLANVVRDSIGEAAAQATTDLQGLALRIQVGGFDESVFSQARATIGRFIDGASDDLQNFQNFANARLRAIGAEPVDFDFSALARARDDLERAIVLGDVDISSITSVQGLLSRLFDDTLEGLTGVKAELDTLVERRVGEVDVVANVSRARTEINRFANAAETRLAALSSSASRSLEDISGAVTIDDDQLQAAGRRILGFVDRSKREIDRFAESTNAALAGIGAKTIDVDFSQVDAAREALAREIELGNVDVSSLRAVESALAAIGFQLEALVDTSDRNIGRVLEDIDGLARSRTAEISLELRGLSEASQSLRSLQREAQVDGRIKLDRADVRELALEVKEFLSSSTKRVEEFVKTTNERFASIKGAKIDIDLSAVESAGRLLAAEIFLGDINTGTLEKARSAIEALGNEFSRAVQLSGASTETFERDFETLSSGVSRSLDRSAESARRFTSDIRQLARETGQIQSGEGVLDVTGAVEFDSTQLQTAGRQLAGFISESRQRILDFREFTNRTFGITGATPIEIDLTALEDAQTRLEEGLKLGAVDLTTLQGVVDAVREIELEFEGLVNESSVDVRRVREEVERLVRDRSAEISFRITGFQEAIQTVGELRRRSEVTGKLSLDDNSIEEVLRAVVNFTETSKRQVDDFVTFANNRLGTFQTERIRIDFSELEAARTALSESLRLGSIDTSSLVRVEAAIRSVGDSFLGSVQQSRGAVSEFQTQFKNLAAGIEATLEETKRNVSIAGSVEIDDSTLQSASRNLISFIDQAKSELSEFRTFSNSTLQGIGAKAIDIDFSDLDAARKALARGLQLGKVDISTLEAVSEAIGSIQVQFRTLVGESEVSIEEVLSGLNRIVEPRSVEIAAKLQGVDEVQRRIETLNDSLQSASRSTTNAIQSSLEQFSRAFSVGQVDTRSLESAANAIDTFVDSQIEKLAGYQAEANSILAGIQAPPIEFNLATIEEARRTLRESLALGTIDFSALEAIEAEFKRFTRTATDSVAGVRSELEKLDEGLSIERSVKEVTDSLNTLDSVAKRAVTAAIGEFRNISRVLAGEGKLSETIIGATFSFIVARIDLAMRQARLSFEGLSGAARGVASETINAFGALADGTIRVAAQGIQAITRFIFEAFDQIGSLGGLIKLAIFGPSDEQILQINTILQNLLNAEAVGQTFRQSLAETLTDIQVKIDPTIDPENTAITEFAERLNEQIKAAVAERETLSIDIEVSEAGLRSLKSNLEFLKERALVEPLGGRFRDAIADTEERIERVSDRLEKMRKRSTELTGQIALSNAQFAQMSVRIEKIEDSTLDAFFAQHQYTEELASQVALAERLVERRKKDLAEAILIAEATGNTVELDKVRLALEEEIAKQTELNTKLLGDQIERVSRFPSRIRQAVDELKGANKEQERAIIAVLQAQRDLLKSEEDSATIAEKRINLTKELLTITKELGLSSKETLELFAKITSPQSQQLPQVQRREGREQQLPTVRPVIDTSAVDVLNATLRGESRTQQNQSASQFSRLNERLDSTFDVRVDDAFRRSIESLIRQIGQPRSGVGGFVGEQQLARGRGFFDLEGGVPLELIREVFEQTALGIEDVGLSAQTLLDAVQSIRQEARTGEAPGRRVGETEGFQISDGQIVGISPEAVGSEIGQEILKSLAGREAVLEFLSNQGLQIRHLALLEDRLKELVQAQKKAAEDQAAFGRDFGEGAGGTGAGTSTLQGVRAGDVSELIRETRLLRFSNDNLKEARDDAKGIQGELGAARAAGADPTVIQALEEKLETAQRAVKEFENSARDATERFRGFTEESKAFTGLATELAAIGKIDPTFLQELSKEQLGKLGRDRDLIPDADLRKVFRDAARGNKEAQEIIKRAQEEAKDGADKAATGTKGLGEEADKAAPKVQRLGEESETSKGKVKTLGDETESTKSKLTNLGTESDTTKNRFTNLGVESDTLKSRISALGIETEVLKTSAASASAELLKIKAPEKEEPAEGEKPPKEEEGTRKRRDEGKKEEETTKAEEKKDKLETDKVQEVLRAQIKAVKEGLEKQLQEVLKTQEEVNAETAAAIQKQQEMVDALDNALARIGDRFDELGQKFERAIDDIDDLGDAFEEFSTKTVSALETMQVQINNNATKIAINSQRISNLGG